MIRLAVLDANQTRWQAFAARLRGVAQESLPACDAAVFLDPPQGDGLEIERCLQAGKHVVTTAAAWLSQERLQTLTGLARQANVRFVALNPDRYLPSRQLIRQQLDAGKLGEPGLIRIHRWEPAGSRLRDLDVVLWYFSKTPNRVYAIAHGGGVLIHLGFPGGGMALLDHVERLPRGDRYYYLSVIGSSGAAYADDHQNMQLSFRGGSPQALRTDEGIGHWAALVQEFADSLERPTGSESYPTIWRDVLSVADAVQKSLRTRQAVEPEGVQ